ncbi:MAG TPA: response regulator [Candidatus Omnitrophota bacterium]|nr:response regulator [Candidatus Omnitrophota bacterium]HPS19375.1 response regulator [Candidatus Omnitrophota bacterium]
MKNMRILIVDDDYISRTKLKGVLSAHGDCDSAPDGDIALQLFAKAHKEKMPYDLITVDIEMEGMNGQELVHLLRAWEEKNGIQDPAKVKVIMITVKKEIKEVTKSFFEGCNAYCAKPITPEAILKALGEIKS